MIRSTFVRGTCLFGALTALAFMGACSHGAASKQGEPGMEASTQGGMNEQSMAQACPMSIPGTQVAARDTDNGAALEFSTTNSDQLDALRQKVQALADMHNKMVEQMGQSGMSGQGGSGMSGQSQTGSSDQQSGMSGQSEAGSSSQPQAGVSGSEQSGVSGSEQSGVGGSGCLVAGAKAEVENTDNGARLVFQPSGQMQAEDLRQSVRSLASQMSSGSCSMACMGSMGAQPGMQQPSSQPGSTENQGGTMEGTPQPGTEQQGQSGSQNEGQEQGGTESQPGSSGY